MDLIFGVIDPSAAAAWLLILIFALCTGLLYTMRDPLPFPRRVARRVHCPWPEHRGHTFTVEVLAAQTGAVCYCSAFPYGELQCDAACIRNL